MKYYPVPQSRKTDRSLSMQLIIGNKNYSSWSLPVSAGKIQDLWRECRKRFGEKDNFLFGNFSIADAMFAPVAFRFNRYGVKGEAQIQDYMNAILSLPATQEWEDAARQEPWIIAENEK